MSSWPRVPLRRLITQSRDVMSVDDLATYRRCGVQLRGEGALLRDEVLGQAIRTKQQQVCRAGQLLVAEIDAKLGGFAVVPPELEGAIVSSHYFLFAIDADQLDTDFLACYLRTETFQSQVRAQGSTNYAAIRPSDVLSYLIPLPPLDEQVRVARALGALSNGIRASNDANRDSARQLQHLLRKVFSQITSGALRLPMGTAAPLVRRPVNVDPLQTYHELGIRSFGNGTFHKPGVPGVSLGSKRIFEMHPGDLVFSNVFAWEGAVAVVQPDDEGRVASHRFMTCVPDPAMARAEFLWYYLLTDDGLAALGASSPGGAGRNRTLSVDGLSRITVPCPDRLAQDRFVRLLAVRGGIERLHAESEAAGWQLLRRATEAAFATPERS